VKFCLILRHHIAEDIALIGLGCSGCASVPPEGAHSIRTPPLRLIYIYKSHKFAHLSCLRPRLKSLSVVRRVAARLHWAKFVYFGQYCRHYLQAVNIVEGLTARRKCWGSRTLLDAAYSTIAEVRRQWEKYPCSSRHCSLHFGQEHVSITDSMNTQQKCKSMCLRWDVWRNCSYRPKLYIAASYHYFVL
jgi:hypothetical protein